MMLFSLLLSLSLGRETLPLVVWHGAFSSNADASVAFVESALPHVNIHTVTLTGGFPFKTEIYASVFGFALDQVDATCKTLLADKGLARGMDMLGFDQGGLFLRAVVQRCDGLSVRSLVTLGAPHRGWNTIPTCADSVDSLLCQAAMDAAKAGAYSDDAQRDVLFFQYFHDVQQTHVFEEKCSFLPVINDVKGEHPIYAKRLGALEAFVMVGWPKDSSEFAPRVSEMFGFDGKDLKETQMYADNVLGLKDMDEKGKLHFLNADKVDYPKMSTDWFLTNVADKFFSPRSLPTPFPAPPATTAPSPTTPSPTHKTTGDKTTTTGHKTTTTGHKTTTTGHKTTTPRSTTHATDHSSHAGTHSTSGMTTVPKHEKCGKLCPKTAAAWKKLSANDVASLNPACFSVDCALTEAETGVWTAAQCGDMTGKQLEMLTTGCAGIAPACVGGWSVDAIAGVSYKCAKEMTAKQALALAPQQTPHLSLKTIPGFSPAFVGHLTTQAFAALTSTQVNALHGSQLKGLTCDQVGALHDCKDLNVGLQSALPDNCCKDVPFKCVMNMASWRGFEGACVAGLNQTIFAEGSADQVTSLSPSGWSGVPIGTWRMLVAKRLKLVEHLTPKEVRGVPAATANSLSNDIAHQNLDTTDLCKLKKAPKLANATFVTVAEIQTNSSRCLEPVSLITVQPHAITGVRDGHVVDMKAPLFRNFTADQLRFLQPVANISAAQVHEITPKAFLGLCASLGDLNRAATDNITNAQLMAVVTSADNCTSQASRCTLLHKIGDHQRATLEDTEDKFAAELEACKKAGYSIGGWTATDTWVLIICAIVFLVILVSCFVLARMKVSRREDERAPLLG